MNEPLTPRKDGDAFLRTFQGEPPFEMKPIEFDDVTPPKFKFVVITDPKTAPAESR